MGVTTPFRLTPGRTQGAWADVDQVEEGFSYHGPFEPLVMPISHQSGPTRVLGPDGYSAELAWSLYNKGKPPLRDEGVALRLSDRSLVLRQMGGLSRDGRSIRLEEGGRPYARIRFRGLTGLTLERMDGTPVGRIKGSSRRGEVEEAADRDDVTVLMMMIGCALANHMRLNWQLI